MSTEALVEFVKEFPILQDMQDINYMHNSFISVFSDFIFYTGLSWARRYWLGMPCNAERARTPYRQYIYSQHFSETNFTSSEQIGRSILLYTQSKTSYGLILYKSRTGKT